MAKRNLLEIASGWWGWIASASISGEAPAGHHSSASRLTSASRRRALVQWELEIRSSVNHLTMVAKVCRSTTPLAGMPFSAGEPVDRSCLKNDNSSCANVIEPAEEDSGLEMRWSRRLWNPGEAASRWNTATTAGLRPPRLKLKVRGELVVIHDQDSKLGSGTRKESPEEEEELDGLGLSRWAIKSR